MAKAGVKLRSAGEPLYTYSDVLHGDMCHDAQVVVVEVLHGFLDDVQIPYLSKPCQKCWSDSGCAMIMKN